MYQSTAEFGNLVQQDSRTFKCLLTYDKVSITKVKSIKLTGGSEAEDDFPNQPFSRLASFVPEIIRFCMNLNYGKK